MQPKRVLILASVAIPLFAYVITTLAYAHGSYDGKNCAGLLDAVWECSEFEYYLDWLINPFILMALLGYAIISSIVTPVVWYMYKKYNKSKHADL